MKSKWIMLLLTTIVIKIFGVPLVVPAEATNAITETKTIVTKQKSCSSCHDDFTHVLSKEHPSVKGNLLSSCTDCHAPEEGGMAKTNKFDATIHLSHLKSPIEADCLDCHTFDPGKQFSLTETTESFGSPSEDDMALLREIFTSVVESNFLDARHYSGNITCTSCHDKDILGENTVENRRCLDCHGPLAELVAKTTPLEFSDRNPHNSHLGEINCTVCHAGHAESKIYCLECHPKFEMKLP